MEHYFKCPYCAAKISMLLDLSGGADKYVEDCEVCCQPIEVSFEVENDEVTNFMANTTEG